MSNQDSTSKKLAKKESEHKLDLIYRQGHYNFNSLHDSNSCFYSKEVDNMDSILRTIEDRDERKKKTELLTKKLSAKERLYHALRYPKRFMQNCSLPPYFKPDGNIYVYTYLPTIYEGRQVSKEQILLLKEKRKEVLELLIECHMGNKKILERNLYDIIIDLEAWELLEKIVDNMKIDDTETPSIMTVMHTIMKAAKFHDFEKSDIHWDLYVSQKGELSRIQLTKKVFNESIKLFNSYCETKRKARI